MEIDVFIHHPKVLLGKIIRCLWQQTQKSFQKNLRHDSEVGIDVRAPKAMALKGLDVEALVCLLGN